MGKCATALQIEASSSQHVGQSDTRRTCTQRSSKQKKTAFLFSLDCTAWFCCHLGRDRHHLNIAKTVNPSFSPCTSENGSTTTGFVLGVHPSLHATICRFFFRMSTSAPPRCSFPVSLVALFLLMTFAASSSFPQKIDAAPSKSVVFSITALRVKATLKFPSMFSAWLLAPCHSTPPTVFHLP